MSTPLFVAAYDVAASRRRRQMANVVRHYSATGQLSAYECELTPPQQRELLEQVSGIIEPGDDRFVLLKVTAVLAICRSGGSAPSPATRARDWHYLG